MITFERRVPESERTTRAARCIDDVIKAENAAKTQGYKAAAGTAAVIGGAALLGSIFSANE